MRAAAAAAAAAAAVAAAAPLHPLPAGVPPAHVVEGAYIIRMRGSVGAAAHRSFAAAAGATRAWAIGADFRAVHARLTAAELRWALARAEVAHVEHDLRVPVAAAPPAPAPAAANVTRACPDVQGDPMSWGQKRVTAASAAAAAGAWAHDGGWGAGVDVYVLDTGVRVTHAELAGRARWGANFANGSADADTDGHGTHCAGTVAGRTYGVAKGASVVAVKVVGDDGLSQYSDIISGVEWAVAEAKRTGRRGVANLSVDGYRSSALDDAVDAAAAEGLLVVSAAGNAGNRGRDACGVSPASAAGGLTVAATALIAAADGGAPVDARSNFSNWGACVDIFAPGSGILSAHAASDTAVATLSGTSMAAPHAAAACAIALQQHPEYSAAEVRAHVAAAAAEGVVADAGDGSPNRLLHVPC